MEKEIPQIAKDIEEISKQIISRLQLEKEYHDEVVTVVRKYKEEVAKTTAALALGATFELDGQKIKDLGATSRKALVDGLCAKWEADSLIAKAKHKRLWEQIEELQSKRISKQTIFKHLDET